MNHDGYYPAYSTNGTELDPNAVNELFENVVYGEGIEVYGSAQQRRLEADRRRLEIEQRAKENAEKRAQAEKDRQFFDTLILSGPDRPVSKPDKKSLPANTSQPRPAKIQIPFTAADRSRIPRKTRQQWLDKFQAACDVAFPGALTALEPSLILSLEQSVYQTTKTATAYVGAWMNKIHAMKSAPCLALFLSPDCVNKASSMQGNQHDNGEAKHQEPGPSLPSSTNEETAASADDRNGVEDSKISDPLPSVSTTLLPNPGKASLLGKELPFSLFGSDDEDEADVLTAFQHNDDCIAELPLATHHSESNAITDSESPSAPPDVNNAHQSESDRIGNEPAQSDIDVDRVVADNHSMSDTSCPNALQSRASKSCEEPLPNGETESNKTEMADDANSHMLPEIDNNDVQCEQQRQNGKSSSKKRRQTDRASDQPASKKPMTRFHPECKTFICDVVAAHLRLRFGRELSGKDVVSVQSRIVGKILSDPKWTLERLRKHKRNIDDLAEHYANRIRRERRSSKTQQL